MMIDITEISCFKCGIVFWITTSHNKELLRCKNTFYCPNGHGQCYTGESDKEKIKHLEESLKYKKRYANSLSRSNSALRGVITKMKKKLTGEQQ